MTRLLPIALFLAIVTGPASADMLVAARNIRALEIISEGDVDLTAGDAPGMLIDPAEAIGQEARVLLYAGRPIRIGDVGPAAIIERNAIVPLIYATGGLHLSTEARALGRAGVGDSLRVMNLSSRSVVTGWVAPDGAVHVGQMLPVTN